MPNRVLGSWLGGPRSSGLLPPREEPAYPGARLGLPAEGPGSLATVGRRLLAFLTDCAVSVAVAALIVWGFPREWSTAVFVAEVLLLTAATGRTVGMRVWGLRVRPVRGEGVVGVRRALVRTLLLVLFIPAFVVDIDGRGLHDRLAGTVLVEA